MPLAVAAGLAWPVQAQPHSQLGPFADLAALTKSRLARAPAAAAVDAGLLESLCLKEAAGRRAVVVDGVFRPEFSDLSALPPGVFVGSVAGAPAEAAQQLGSLSNAAGGPFAVLNGAMAADALAVVLPVGAHVPGAIHVLYVATGGSDASGVRAAAAPRLLLVAGADACAEVVEEFVGAGGEGGGFTCAVAEVVLGAEAAVKHGYAEREAGGAVHIKSTLVSQVGEGGEGKARAACTGAVACLCSPTHTLTPGSAATPTHYATLPHPNSPLHRSPREISPFEGDTLKLDAGAAHPTAHVSVSHTCPHPPTTPSLPSPALLMPV